MTTEYDFTQTPAAALSAQIEKISMDLPGFQSAQRGKQMAQLVLDVKPWIAVEIGVYGGRSLIPVALAMKHNNKGMIFGIDPWDSAIHHEGLSEHQEDGDLSQNDLNIAYAKMWGAVCEYNLGKQVNIIKGRSRDVFMEPCLLKQIDILHIDGAHSKDAASYDATVYGAMVKSGGYIWVDDTNWPPVKHALQIIEMDADCVSDQGTYRLYKVR